MDKVNPETVIVKDSKFGKGLFATTDLPKRTILLKITGTPLTFDDTLNLGTRECYSLQVGIDKYVIPDYPFHLSNHSCDPNCGLTRNLEYITLRDIKEGEELCWDYSTSMLEKHWEMRCECGSPICRHLIQDFDLLPLKIQEKYLHMKLVLPFITEELYGLPTIERADNSQVLAR